VNRGFLDYQSLYGEHYKTIHNDDRLKKIIEKIKDKIGIGKQAKDFTIELLSGCTFCLSKQKGKVILINFWTTWSDPCLAEIPSLKEYYTEYKDRGFEIIGISLDHSKNSLEKYIKEENLEWKISFSGKGWLDEVRELYGVESIPSNWLIDRKGTLRFFGLREEKLRKAQEELISD
jgi:peroxiredoxin